MEWVPTVFAAVVAALGWHYLFYSRAAHRLAILEQEPINRLRVRLRRVGGACMLLLGFCFFALFNSISLEKPSALAAIMLLAILFLLGTILALAIADVRLTWKLRRRS